METVIVKRLQAALEHIGQNEGARASLWGIIASYTEDLYGYMLEATRTGYYSKPHATDFCSFAQCSREVAFSGLHIERSNPPDWRGQSTFVTGYLIECKLKALMDYAGFIFDSMAYDLSGWVTPEEHQIKVQPDLTLEVNKELREEIDRVYNVDVVTFTPVELKSISANGFEFVQNQGTRIAKPGYYDQCQLEMVGTGAPSCLILYENKNDGSFHEELIPFDKRRYDELYWLFVDVFKKGDPLAFPRTHDLEAITEFHRGKHPPVGAGPAIPRYGKNDDIYGWDVVTGRALKWQCDYCGWRNECWEGAIFDRQLVSGKPRSVLVEEREVAF